MENNLKKRVLQLISKQGFFDVIDMFDISPNELSQYVDLKNIPKEVLYKFLDDVHHKTRHSWIPHFYERVPILKLSTETYTISTFGFGKVFAENEPLLERIVHPYENLPEETLHEVVNMAYGVYYTQKLEGRIMNYLILSS